MSYDPAWDLELTFGSEGERKAAAQLAWLLRNPDCIHVEVKTKRMADTGFYVEHTNTSGAPSGIRLTLSDLWYVLIEPVGIGVAIPTPLLRAAFLAGVGEETAHQRGRTPTQGRLIHLPQLIRWGVGHPGWH